MPTVSVKDASNLFKEINIKLDALDAKRAFYAWKTDITVHKSRKDYVCINNETHKIDKKDHYARIAESNSPMAWSETMCMTCAARILIILLTNFSPIGNGGWFHYPSPDNPEKV